MIYRSHLVKDTAQWIDSNQCCVIVGLRGMGKSSFLRYLHFNLEKHTSFILQKRKILTCLLDCNRLPELTSTGFFYEALRSLKKTVIDKKIDINIISKLTESNRINLFIEIDELLEELCNNLDYHLVFLIDKFEKIVDFEEHFFSNLRAWRDSYWPHVNFILGVHQGLATNNDIWLQAHLGEFGDLFAGRALWIELQSKEDCRVQINNLAATTNARVSEGFMQDLITLSGGHPGLLTAMWWANREMKNLSPSDYLKFAAVQRTIRALWNDLGPSIQLSLKHLVTENTTSGKQEDLKDLSQIGLWNNTVANLFSPIFEFYVKHAEPGSGGLRYDTDTGDLYREGIKLYTKLTPSEHRLMEYFQSHPEIVSTINELVNAVYDSASDDISILDSALKALIGRLRSKVEFVPSEPRYILTVRGRGYYFMPSGKLIRNLIES